jgi:gluconate 2-dehydrogenase gamma chain
LAGQTSALAAEVAQVHHRALLQARKNPVQPNSQTKFREDVMPNETDEGRRAPRDVSRRHLFKQVGLAGAAAALSGTTAVTAAAEPTAPAAAPTPMAPTPAAPKAAASRLEALETLTAAEADTLEAIVARLIPTDENGPGATEARAAHYIDRALAGALRGSRGAYGAGLAALDAYAQSTKGAPFAKLTPQAQDAVLTDLEKNVATGFTPSAAAFFTASCAPTPSGHVLRSLLRRQRRFRGLGSDRLSRHPHGGHAGRAAHERAGQARASIRL